MKVLRKKSLAMILTFALFFVCLFTGMGFLTAHAEEKIFSYNSVTGRVKLGGISDQDVTDAFEAEGARLKAEMEAAGYSFPTLQAGNQPLANGWPSDANRTLLCAHLNLGDFDRTANAWSNDYALMVFNPNTKAAYTLRGYSCTLYVNWNGGWGVGIYKYGFPTGNRFTVGETSYQNFALGYAKMATSNEFVFGKKVDATGAESDLTGADIANGLILNTYDVDDGINVAEIKAAYAAYYTDSINTEPFVLSNGWRQETTGGGNVIYNTARKEMFTVTSTFLNGYNNNSAKWGAPVGEESEIHGVTNQLFANGVAYLDDTTVKFEEASHVDPATGDIVPNFTANSVGVVSAAAEAKLPVGVSKDSVQTAVQAVYDDDMGIPGGEMEFFAYSTVKGFDYLSDEILMQTFVGQDDQKNTTTTIIYLDVTASPLAAVVMDNDTYALYKLPTRFNEGNKAYDVTGEMVLGPAISDAFEVGSTKYQNFLFGAIDLTSTDAETQILPGVNYAKDGTRTVLDLSDFITINESTIHIPPSYNINADDLLAKFKADYKAYVAQGIALGMPNQEGIGSWIPDTNAGGGYTEAGEFLNERGMIKLGLHMTDSDAICYYGVTAMLAYSPKDGNVYIMSDAVISNMATYYSVYGAPTCNLTETKLKTGSGQEVTVYIQNFELGYLTVMNGSASMTADKNWNFNLGGPVNLDGSKIPGTTYPGEQTGGNGNNNNGDNNGDNNGGSNEETKGCGGEFSVAAGIGIAVMVVTATVLIVVKKRREQ